MEAMNIVEAAEVSGVSIQMIRHYERRGLTPAAKRTDAGYRQNRDADLQT